MQIVEVRDGDEQRPVELRIVEGVSDEGVPLRARLEALAVEYEHEETLAPVSIWRDDCNCLVEGREQTCLGITWIQVDFPP